MPSVSEPWSLGGSEAGGGRREEGENETRLMLLTAEEWLYVFSA